MTPAIGKNWNDRLLAEKHPEQFQSTPERGDRETLKSLWKWYRIAVELEKSEAYRQRITEIAQDMVDGMLLSEKAIAAMQRDFQQFESKQSNPTLTTSKAAEASP